MLLGRARELALVESHVEAVQLGHNRLVLLEGEPGIGKTRLADELCGMAGKRGFLVARGAALAEAGAPALAPWRAVARSLGTALRKILDTDAAAMSGATDEARWRRFEAFSDALFEHAGDRPLLIALDDLHDADVASVELLLFWVRNVQHGHWLLLGTLRDAATRLSKQNDVLLARLAREGVTIHVGPLSLDDVSDLTRAQLGTASEATFDVSRVYELTRGNPLFVTALLAQLERGQPLAAARVPASIAAALRARLHGLGEAAQTLIHAAAVLGVAPTLPVLARVLDIPTDNVLTRLAEPIRAGILIDDGSLRVRFSHPLLREITLEELPRARRAQWHLSSALALEALANEGMDVPSAEIAVHRASALPLGDGPSAVRALLRAAGEADKHLALEEAVQLRERAREIVASFAPLPAAERCDLELAHSRALSGLGARARAQQAAASAAAFARSAGDAERLARAALARGADFSLGVTDHGLVDDLRAARAGLPATQPGLLARVEARLAAALQPAADPLPQLELARSALARAQAAHDPEALLQTQLSVGAALSDYAPLAERIAVARDMVALATQRGERRVALRGHLRLALDQLELGDLSGSDLSIDAYARLAATFGPPHYHWTTPLLYSMRAAIHGRFQEAERWAEQGHAIGQRGEDPNARIAYALQRITLLRQCGDRAAFETASLELGELENMEGGRVWTQILRASCCARLGYLDEAALAVSRVARDHPVLRVEPPAACLMIEALAYLDTRTRDREFVASLRSCVEPRRDQYLGFGVMMLAWDGPCVRYLGLAQRLLGEIDAAIDSLSRAQRMAQALGAEPAALWAGFDLAEALAERGTAPDRERRAALLTEVERAAERLGIVALRKRTRALSSDGSRATAIVSPPPTAAPVLQLVLEGETWRLCYGERTLRLKDSRGLRLLDQLLQAAGRELHVLELAGSLEPAALGDAGEVLDPEAIASYRQRAAELREDIEQAARDHDLGRSNALRKELEAIAEQLAQGVGLGGRARRAAAASERARVNVQRRLKDAIERIRALDAELGARLERAVCTGTFCSYREPV